MLEVYKNLFSDTRRKHIINAAIYDRPRFLQPNAACSSLAQEITNYLYAKTTHWIDDRSYASSVESYFRRDAFGVGITPLDVEIKAVDINILVTPARYTAIKQSVAFLPQIRTSTTGFKLSLCLDHGVEFCLKDLVDLFQHLNPILQHLQSRGAVAATWGWHGLVEISLMERMTWSYQQWCELLWKLVDALQDTGDEDERLLLSTSLRN
jgi:hypothetical protein